MKGLCHRRKHVAERNTMGLRFPTYVKLVLRYLNLLGQQKWNEELDSREQTLHLWAHNARYLESTWETKPALHSKSSAPSIAVTQAPEEGETTGKQRHKALQTYWAFRRLRARPRSE